MLSTLTTAGQTNKFEELTNKLLFRIGTYQSDSTTSNFIKKYIPFLATKSKPGKWIAYPPNEDITPDDLTIHSLIFTKHPFVEIEIQEGRLDILTREKNNKVIGLRAYYVTFMFTDKQNGKKAFDKLCKMYNPISTKKNIVQRNNKKIAVYKNDNAARFSNQVEFILTQDELFDKKYKIVFGAILDPLFAEYYGIQE